MSDSNKNIFNITDEINWPYVVKKEARGIDNADFGEVQEIVLHYILTEKGIINKETFYLPTELVEEFDGDRLQFNISEQDANEKFRRDSPPSADEYSIYKKKEFTMSKKEQQEIKNKNISISLNSDNSLLKEVDEDYNDKINLEQQDNGLHIKTSDLKNDPLEEKAIMEKTKQEFEDKARLEAERNAHSIAQQIQDKAKMDAERKAQSIIQQAEDKARAEAERRSKEITQQAEDKANEILVTDEQSRLIEAQENIVSKKANAKTINSNPQEEIKLIGTDNSIYSNSIFNPFEIGVSMWQNYYLFFLNITKEITKNATKTTKDIENILQKII
ncbi:MAG: hypothetical protein ACTHKJ_10775 [Candidatus Nitrosocosmicus sp.]